MTRGSSRDWSSSGAHCTQPRHTCGLSEVFGEMEPSATSFLNSVDNPFLMELRQTPGNPRARRYVLDGDTRVGYIGWHWDQSFMPTIVRGAVLRMVEPAAPAD